MSTLSFLSVDAMPTRGRRIGGVACMLAATLLLSHCAHKKDQDDKPSPYSKDSSRPPRDPVEDRIFYQGWRHPN